jgi:26S proteasome regulatory subunit N5
MITQSGKLQEALDKLFVLEKQTRNVCYLVDHLKTILTDIKAADLTSTTRLAKAIIQHTYDARNHTLLNSSIQTLSKKHGQLKAVIQAFVEQAIEWLHEIKSRDGTEKWLELVETLRSVTEGKVNHPSIPVQISSLISFTDLP